MEQDYYMKIRYSGLSSRELLDIFQHISTNGMKCKGFDINFIYIKGKLTNMSETMFLRTYLIIDF